MHNDLRTEQELQRRFSDLGRLLIQAFPNDDLRFNRAAGSPLLRIHAPEYSNDSTEVELEETEMPRLLHEAIFSVKQLLQRYDA